jgi:hypothetical protein
MEFVGSIWEQNLVLSPLAVILGSYPLAGDNLAASSVTVSSFTSPFLQTLFLLLILFVFFYLKFGKFNFLATASISFTFVVTHNVCLSVKPISVTAVYHNRMYITGHSQKNDYVLTCFITNWYFL